MANAFSTAEELQADASFIKSTWNTETDPSLSDFCTERIALADKIIRADLASYVSFMAIDALAAVPSVLNLLSRYKAAELACARAGAVKVEKGQKELYNYYQTEYNKLLKRITSGAVIITDAAGNSVANSVSRIDRPDLYNSKPYFGHGKYGTGQTDQQIEDDRDAGLEL